MNCEGLLEMADAYVDNELDVLTAAQFERHLVECSSCREAFEKFRTMHDTVKARIPPFVPPPGLESGIRRHLYGRDHGDSPRRERISFWPGLVVAAGVTVLLVLSGLIFQFNIRSSPSESLVEQVVSSHIRSLMANHLSDIVSTDQHTVKPWFTGKLDFSPTVKDLSPEGFPLIGGRLDYLDNRPVAALVYKRNQHTINLFIWPFLGSDSNLRTKRLKGFNVVHWTTGGMTYWAVSDLNDSELREFAEELRPSP